jgi:hypothetical protein
MELQFGPRRQLLFHCPPNILLQSFILPAENTVPITNGFILTKEQMKEAPEAPILRYVAGCTVWHEGRSKIFGNS